MVEHNLAKVGVASSSLVFRSLMKSGFYSTLKAQVAELVDAHVSGACAARRAGSIPVLGTGTPSDENLEGFCFIYVAGNRRGCLAR